MSANRYTPLQDRVQKTCKQCGASFPQRSGDRNLFCSRKCSRQGSKTAKREEGERWEKERNPGIIWIAEKREGKIIYIERVTPHKGKGQKEKPGQTPKPAKIKPVKIKEFKPATKKEYTRAKARIKPEPQQMKIRDTTNCIMVRVDSKTWKLKPIQTI